MSLNRITALGILLAGVTLSACNDASTTAAPDTAPPLAPESVRAYTKADGQVTVSWSRNTEPDLAGYNVYVMGPRMRLNGGLVTTSQFATHAHIMATQIVRVTAVDISGNESAPSKPVHVEQIDATPSGDPAGPTNGGE